MVFYFTGTGNSLYVAKKLDMELISIPQAIRSKELTFISDKIGIVCPIYGHEMPAMVKEFLEKATFVTDYLYLIITYGNRHGGAADLAYRFLQSVGKNATYINTIMMVDNFLPAFDMTEELRVDKRVDEQLSRIQADLEAKRSMVQKAGLQDKAAHEMYRAYVKNQPETVWAAFQITDDCIGCGICTRVCPAGCIYLEDQKAIHTMEGCQACYACVHACPKASIQFTLSQPEKNPTARYRNPHIALSELIVANNQKED